MNKKKIIWILGSNATGKTTQSRLLHEKYANGEKRIFNFKEGDYPVKYTTFGSNIGHVGLIGDNQCTGTDTLNSKVSVEMSTLYCLNLCDMVIVDGILATATWIDIFNQFPDSVEVYMILLQFDTLEDNLMRLSERRMMKDINKGVEDPPLDVEQYESLLNLYRHKFEERTMKNMSNKFKIFKSIYDRTHHKCKKSIQISANLTESEVFSIINKFIP